MWDSSGRLRSPGKFDARWTDFGRYDACVDLEVAERNVTAIDTNHPKKPHEILIPAFTGKYFRLFSAFTPSQGSHLGALHFRIQRSIGTSDATATTSKPRSNWNISVIQNGEDKLSNHKDFGLDFEALGITNVLLQDFILVGF